MADVNDDSLTAIFTRVCSVLLEEKPLSSMFFIRKRRNDDLFVSLALTDSQQRRKRAKIVGYVHDIVPRYSNEIFKSHFRMSRLTVEILMKMLPTKISTRKPYTPKENIVLMCLWLLGNQESFRGVSDRFGMSQSHANTEFTKFCYQLLELAPHIIKWPKGEAAQEAIKEFADLRVNSLPNTLGCIDGTHILFSVRKHEKNAHINRKQVASVILQAICTADLKFIDVFTGWPGSANDARVYRNSPIAQAIANDLNLLPNDSHILGDCAYPLSRHLLTPFRDNGHLGRKEKIYNKVFKLDSSCY
ncbi:uncharacterized protein [Centruroides vittatus]|uniref:uncharacterized protein n=1 Tax=Centruroides vittatus TaxID=120091 RepID=UPI00350F6BAB